jgi:dTDP-glucose 4,6-dehydratase
LELSGKNIFVTGGAGFIGSALVRELLTEGSNIVIYDNFASGDRSNIEEIKDRVTLIKGDIRDPEIVNHLKEHKIDCVFNLAAEPYIPHCYDRPKNFFEVNANGALNIMLSSKEAGVARILQYSSSEVYGTAQYVPMDEHHPTIPCSTYAVSKLAADRLCYTLYHEQDLPIIIMRQFNTYGPRETHPYIIPELITQLSNSNKLKLGNIKARRDLTYIDDSAKGAVALMKCDEAVGEVVNLGYGQDWSVEELAYIIAKLMGHDSIEIEVEDVRLRPLDVERLQCNYFKAHKLIGWDPKVGIEEGLGRTIEWYKENEGKWPWEKKIASEDEIWHKGL